MLVKEQTTSVKEQTTSDNVNFVCEALCELTTDMNTNEKNTLIKHLPEILETAKKTKEWGFNFMTGKIDIFDEETKESNSDSSDRVAPELAK